MIGINQKHCHEYLMKSDFLVRKVPFQKDLGRHNKIQKEADMALKFPTK